MPVIRQEISYNQEVVSNDGIQYIRVSQLCINELFS
jgi:hypothetical protein